jgi:hypothetical protein
MIDTVVGTGCGCPSGDGGPASSAGINHPSGAIMHPSKDGSILILENGGGRVRRWHVNGTITLAAGSGPGTFGGDGGPATLAAFNNPYFIAAHPTDGSYYVSDNNNRRIRRIGADNIVSTIIGNGVYSSTGDGGPASSATVASVMGLAFDPRDNSLYIGDTNRIRRIFANLTIVSFAGTGSSGYSGDGGPASSATMNGVYGITMLLDGSLVFADNNNHRIRRIGTDGIISLFASKVGYIPPYSYTHSICCPIVVLVLSCRVARPIVVTAGLQRLLLLISPAP